MSTYNLKFNPLVNNLIYRPAFWMGYRSFLKTGVTPPFAYKSFRQLFCASNGRLNDSISARLSTEFPAPPVQESTGIYGLMNPTRVQDIVAALDRDGVFVFEEKLPLDKIDSLVQWAKTTPAKLDDPKQGFSGKAVYEEQAPKATRYMFDQQDLFNGSVHQEILSDRGMYDIAAQYLRCEPICDLYAMWWSTPVHKRASDAAAQLYHFDLDRLKYIKFFVYLTDVSPDTGPHMYVRGSHRGLPKTLRRDGRISDQMVHQLYPTEDILELTGVKGSMMAIDTRGLHKGKPLVTGDRLIHQIEFTNSLFGQSYAKPIVDVRSVQKKFGDLVKQQPRTWSRVTLT